MPHLVRGAGEHYLPLPNARLVEPNTAVGVSDVEVFAPAGTPVHAVCAGTVGDGDGATLRIEGEDGHTCVYTTVQERRVAPGERVDAGAIVGVIGADGDRHVLRLTVTDRRNAPVRPHELLLGAVDPNDLGYGPGGTGTDLDPDASSASSASSASRASRARTAPGPVARPAVEAKPKRQPPPATSRAATPSTARPATPQPVTAPPATSRSTTARPAAPRPATARPAPPRPAPPVPAPPTPSPGAAAPEREPEPAPDATEPAPPDKAPPVVIPPPPPPVPLIDKPKDETDEEPSAPSRSEEQQRSRAAMLIASRRRRPDTGSQR